MMIVTFCCAILALSELVGAEAVAATDLLLTSPSSSSSSTSATTTTFVTSTTTASATNKQSVVSFPLVPHHVQRRRLLQQTYYGPLGLDTSSSTTESHNHRLLHREEQQRRLSYHDRPRDHLRTINRRDLGSDTDSNSKSKMQIAHLFQGYGTHYVDLWCGQPTPQRQTVIVDTGSGVTAFPCVGCDPEACGVPKYHLDPLYDPTGSTTYRKLDCSECQRGTCSSSSSGSSECRIGMSYQEGSSWNAFEVQDHCYVGGLHATALTQDNKSPVKDDLDPFHAPAFGFPLTFGCQTKLTGLFKTQLADGIMGMDHADVAFWKQMSTSLGLANQFSLCFSRSPTASREGTNAGAMTLGGTDARLHDTDMVYTTVSGGSGFYDVSIRQMYLREGGGESAVYDASAKVIPLLSNPTSAIVDSGTTDTYFSRSMKSSFESAWKQLAGGHAFTHADVSMSDEELHSRPTILLQLAGDVTLNQATAKAQGGTVVGLAGELDPDHPYDVILAVPASHYYEYDEESDTYTARFYVEEGGGNVIGANSMMGHEVFFDVDNDRIGWSESLCDYPALVQPFLDSGALVPAPTPATEDSRKDPKQDEPTDDNTAAGDSAHNADKPGGDIQQQTTTSACSAKCKFGMVTALMLAGVLVVIFLVRRGGGSNGGRKRTYRMAHTELELGELPSNDDSDDFDDAIQYRDHPSSRNNGGGALQGDPDDDEQETGILS